MSESGRILRWFACNRTLIGRPDSAEALRERLARAPRYLEELDAALDAASEAANKYPDDKLIQAKLEKAELDFDQVQGNYNEMVVAAAKLGPSNQVGEATGQAAAPAVLSRLPNLDLPSFSHGYENWTSFINVFDSLVHTRADVSPSQKMGYLCCALSGEAREFIAHLDVCDGNYDTARQLLMQRYQNLRRIADAHVSRILSLPTARIFTLRSEFLNPLRFSYNSLEKLHFPVEEWSYLLLHIVLNKLPTDLKLRFEQGYGKTDSPLILPLFTDFLTFLEEEARVVDNIQRPAAPQQILQGSPGRPSYNADVEKFQRPVAPQQMFQGPRGHPHYNAGMGQSTRAHSPRVDVATVERRDLRCKYCGVAEHALAQCSQFRNSTVSARRQFVRQQQRCWFCFGAHMARTCRFGRPCGYCAGNHNLLLCANRNGGSLRRTGGGESSLRKGGSRSPLPRTSERAPVQPRQGVGRAQRSRSRDDVEARVEAASYAARAAGFSPPLAERPRVSNDIGYVVYSALGSFYIPSCIMVFVYIRIYFAAKARARRGIRKNPRPRPNEQQTSFSNPPKGTRPMPVTHPMPAGHITSTNNNGESQISTIETPQVPIPTVTCDLASDISTSEAGDTIPPPPDERKDTLKVVTSAQVTKNPLASCPLRSSTLSVNGELQLQQARGRAPSVAIDADMVSELEPSSSDSGVVSRCGGVKPLKLRIFKKSDRRQEKSQPRKSELEPALPKQHKPRDPEREKKRLARKKEKRATLILGLIMGSFIACWLPFFFLYILTAACRQCVIPQSAFSIAFWLGYMNSVLNPVIYTIFNKDFRRAFRRILFK